MHKKHGIRALALVLAMVMVLGLIPAAAAAPAQSEAKSFQTIADYLQKQKTTFDRVDPETEVEFIVELDDAPLADSIPAGAAFRRTPLRSSRPSWPPLWRAAPTM